MIFPNLIPYRAFSGVGPLRTRIKICGIRRAGDARDAIAAGADAIGLVFHEGSERAVEIAAARRVVAGLPPLASVVALFVDAPVERVAEVCAALPVSLLQFHGDEPAAYCENFGLPYIKALRVRARGDVPALLASHASASGILLDTWREGVAGGTGRTFDWSLIPRGHERPLLLAGGLNPDNVARAVSEVRPYAVDVSGGVEASVGVKSQRRMRAFVAAVHAADRGGAARR